jgi:putative ABC transport system permease protein
MMSPPAGYTTREGLEAATGQTGRSGNLVVACEDRSMAQVAVVSAALERALAAQGYDVVLSWRLSEMREAIIQHFYIIAAMLVFMSLLVVAVGVLGLSSAMGINVLERSREIGILRSIGAGTHAITRMVVAEGLVIGFISWCAASILAWPLSAFLAERFGMIFFEAPLTFAVSGQGLAIWLGLVALCAAGASLGPGLRAAKIPVREAIAWE